MRYRPTQLSSPSKFLANFRSDEAGNVLAMSAAAIVPLMAMIGGAIDLSRLYMTQTRLQQACDAGALAGRRAMADVNTLSADERATAQNFFKFNFPNNTYAAGTPTAIYARGAIGTVTGTVSLAVPMTIMKMFGYNTVTLNVSCESTLIIPNTDVMFVLDVTGSMSETPSGDTQNKISGLKQAVKDFFSALGPGSSNGAGRVRYGFMPYSSNVNVGKIVYGLSPSYIAGGAGSEKWHYQSRVAQTETDHFISSYGTESGPATGTATNTTIAWGGWYYAASGVGNYPVTYSNTGSTSCAGKAAPPSTTQNSGSGSTSNTGDEGVTYPDNQQTRSYATTQNKITRQYDYYYYSSNNSCRLIYRDGTFTSTTPYSTTRPVNWADREKFVRWIYQDAANDQAFDVSAVVQNGVAPNPTYYNQYWAGTDPNQNIGYDAYGNYYTVATPSTITWNGCIEEAQSVPTINGSSSLDVPSGASDLSIDLIPADTATRWKPFLPSVQFARNGAWLGRDSGWISSGFAACPREASPLSSYASDYVPTTKSSTSFNGYVDSLSPVGGTYHDIGLIWGARFLSQDGIFRATNADSTGPAGFQISRHIVFMTDGALDTRAGANDPWGINNLDGRVAPAAATDADMNTSHLRRTSIICNAMKGKGFTVWVVGFGITTMPQELQECATDTAHWSLSSNSTQLRTRFQQIAQTIGGLRLSQ
jgi:Flp pilus assembly protein TadG